MATEESSSAGVGRGDVDTDADVAGRDTAVGNGALALLAAVNFLVIMDSQIVILALPSIQRGLHVAEAGAVQWVLSAYLLCFGGLLLLGGRLGDVIGRRRVFLAGTAMFGISSLACGLAVSPGMLIAARSVQGVSAAAMAPNALAILTATFTSDTARSRSLAVWGGVGACGASGALLIGGALTSTIGWRWIFLVNVPVAAVLLVLSPRLLPDSQGRRTDRSIDVGGAVTLTGGLFAAILAVVVAPDVGWGSVRTIGLFVVAAVLFCAFALVERRSAAPLLPPALLRSRTLVGGNGAAFAAGMCGWGVGLLTSTYAQSVLGYSPMRFGLASLALTVAALAGNRIGQTLLPRLGARLLLLAAIAEGLGCVLLTGLSEHGSYWADLFAGLAVFGLGLGLTFMVGSVAAMRDVAERDQGVASGINTAAFQLGGALGSAVVASVLAVTAARGPVHGLRLSAVACVVFAVIGLVFACLVSGRTGRALSGEG